MARKRIAVKWIAVTVLGLAMWCPKVRAQCPGAQSALLTQPTETILLPSEINGVTATLTTTVTNVNGGVPSHNSTVTPGTAIAINGTMNNAVSATLKFYANGNSNPYYTTSVPVTGGNLWNWAMNQSNVGNSYQVVLTATDQNGNQTQDYTNTIVVAGSSASIVFQDDFPTDYYLQLGGEFNGSTQMENGCSTPPGTTHTPYMAASFTNPTSGQTVSYGDTNGNSFDPNGSFDERNPVALNLSFRPGDDGPQTTTTGKLKCSVAGFFLAIARSTGDKTKSERVDKKMWTKVWAAQPAGDGGWYTTDWCVEKDPPIWSPNEIYSGLLPQYRYWWTAQTCSSSPLGTDPGPGWHCAEISGGPGVGNPEKFFPSQTSTKGSCNTNINTPAPY